MPLESLKRLGITPFPANFDPSVLRRSREKILFVFPYCVKLVDCPVGRFNDRCLKDCSECAASKIINKLEDLGIDHHISLKLEDTFGFLQKNRGKYRYVIGFGCNRIIEKYAKYAHHVLGLSGYSVELSGETCKTDEDTERAETMGKKRGQTFINEQAVDAILDFIK